MVTDIYINIVHDDIFTLKNIDMRNGLTDVGDTASLVASHLVEAISEYKQIVNDIDKCESFADIMNLANKHRIFECCEEIVVGAFLDIRIDIYD